MDITTLIHVEIKLVHVNKGISGVRASENRWKCILSKSFYMFITFLNHVESWKLPYLQYVIYNKTPFHWAFPKTRSSWWRFLILYKYGGQRGSSPGNVRQRTRQDIWPYVHTKRLAMSVNHHHDHGRVPGRMFTPDAWQCPSATTTTTAGYLVYVRTRRLAMSANTAGYLVICMRRTPGNVSQPARQDIASYVRTRRPAMSVSQHDRLSRHMFAPDAWQCQSASTTGYRVICSHQTPGNVSQPARQDISS